MYEDTPETRAGPAGPRKNTNPRLAVYQRDSLVPETSIQISDGSKKSYSIPGKSYALTEDKGVRTKKGNTVFIMGLMSEMWLFNMFFILGGTFIMTFYIPQFYVDDVLWNKGCWWKICIFLLYVYLIL